jgi:hypothetical protein
MAETVLDRLERIHRRKLEAAERALAVVEEMRHRVADGRMTLVEIEAEMIKELEDRQRGKE